MSHIQTICNSCQSRIKARPDLAGKTARCPKCGSTITIPSPTEESPEVRPATDIVSAKKPGIPPASEKQKDYARKLGVAFPEDIDRKAISSLIDQALAAQDEARYRRLDELQDRESKVRDELKQEVIAELDAYDPRLSIATPDQMVEALQDRAMGVILITFDPDLDPSDLTGVSFNINYSCETIDMEMVKSVIGALFIVTNRKI